MDKIKKKYYPVNTLLEIGIKDILIITQGSEYVIDGDLISFKFEENVQ